MEVSGSIIIDNTKNTWWIRQHRNGQDFQKTFLVKVFHNDFFKSISHAWKSKDTKWVYTFTGKEKKNFEKAFFKEIPQLPIPLKNALKVPEQVVFSASFNNFGALEIVETEALTDEKFEILHRFGKVFDSSYTRFNDLKKAEAQAREAQIETGLERVRSKTMAMHKSEEVTGIAVSLNEELMKLGFEGGSTIIIIDKETSDTEQWTGFSEDKTLQSCYVPYFKHPYHDALLHAWKKEEKFLVYTLTGEEKKTIDEHYFATGYKDFPESDKKWMRQMRSVTFSHAFMKYGAIHWGPGHLTEEQVKILQRFSKVFEQSYTRFLDLQKAEAQAKEAQIEAALEKVRSRSLAMHKSEEMQGVVEEVFMRLKELEVGLDTANILIFKKGTDIVESWTASSNLYDYRTRFLIPVSSAKHFSFIIDAIDNGAELVTNRYEFKEKNEWFNYLFTHTDYKYIPEERKQFILNSPVFTVSVGLSKNIGIQLNSYSRDAFSDEENNILKRFAKVFEQSYTRFEDLQKAEAQAREAQIEAALERVRSRSMAMHKSDDLHEVIKVVTEQLSVLSLKFNAANFAKIDPDGSWDLWLSTPEQAYPAIIHVPYLDHPIFNDITEQIAKNNDFYTRVYNQEEANIFFHHFFENTIAKNTAEERKRFVYSSKGFARSLFLTKNIWFSVSRYDSISFSDEENAIFKRFASVFEQAYTRFLDLQKAEAQAREADIELSLERVRAKTMAMQKPAEFVDVINVIGEQFVHLGFDIEWANFSANGLDILKGIDIWNFVVISGMYQAADRLYIPYIDHPLFAIASEGIDNYRRVGKDLFVINLDKKDKDSWMDHMFSTSNFKDLPDEVRTFQYDKPGYTTSVIVLKDSWLSIGKFDPKPFTEDQNAILRRFAKAFGQAYTRFLDLQKAEAQAREAQIEASLERVRSRAMAMQSSEELRELIGTVFTELTKLDIVLTRCLIMIYDPRSNDSVWWMANSEAPAEPIGLRIQNHGHPPYTAYLKAWQEKKLNWVYVLEGAVKKDWDDFLFAETELSHLPGFVIEGMKAPERVYLNSSFNSFGNLTLASLEPLSEEHFDILLRFAKVFDLTYTRFNDLKQAEAQAKESRIQLALERVRARTMAMQKSNELTETSFLLFQQLKELGSVASQISIGIINEQENVMEMSATIDGSKLDFVIDVSLDEPIVMKKLVGAWKEQKKSLVIDLSGDELKRYNDYRNSSGKLKFETKEGEHWVIHIAFFSKGILSFSSHERHWDETVQLLERFAAVFDLTYTRFLDLQKAEAQTREAQIELALERVRARTMAMHKSEELAETSQVLFQQLSELGGIPDRIAIGIADEPNGVVNFWTTDQQGSRLDHSFSARLNERTTIARTYHAWKEQKRSLVVDLHGEELKEWIQFAREEMGIAVNDDQIKDRRVHSMAFFSHGWILVTSHDPQSPDTIQILERFASVFNLTYRRFLDLQKAEAQANEARIEIALERIRARALAMHKSEELMEVAKVLREQMALLGQPELEASVVHLYEEDPDHILSWRAYGPTDSRDKIAYGHMSLPKNSCEFVREWLTKFYSDEKEYTIELSGAKQDEWYDLFFKFAPDVINSMQQDNSIHDKRYYRFSKFSGGALLMISKQEPSEKVIYLQKRAAVVFDLAYRRFSDLQKTEAQAREAQVEAALEKVRSRSLAMHKSDELQEVVKTVFERLTELNIEMDSANIAIFKEGKKDFDFWIASHFQNKAISFHIAEDWGFPIIQELINARENNESFFSKSFSFEEKNDWFNYAFENTDFKNIEIDRRKYILESKAYALSIAFSKNTGIQINNYSGKLPSEGEIEILKRFSKVFEQAYVRFLDLERAEANAREAQIEAGLERVRATTMAMHSSEDVSAATATMFTELEKLGIQNLRGGITIIRPDQTQEVWSITNVAEGKIVRAVGNFDMRRHGFWREIYKGWVNKEDFQHYWLAGNDKDDYIRILNTTPNYLSQPIKDIPDVHIQSYFFGEGAVWTNSLQPHSEEDKQVMKRFTSVFSLTFRRYQDLKKAEAQAREATIEAALEKVRGKAMAMHDSTDLSVTTSMIITELRKLGISPIRCGVGIIDKETHKGQLYTATSSPDGDSLSVIGWVLLEAHPVLEKIYEKWLAGEDYFPELSGDSRRTYYEKLLAGLSVPVPDFKDAKKHYGHFFSISVGCLYAWADVKYNDDEIKILKRFASIIDLTFRRYFELQKSEANAREAVKQAALDRVRAEIASMRTINDLDRITPLIWNELTILGIPFIRCGVFIMDDEQHLIHTFLSTPDGKAIAAFHLPYDTTGNLAHVVANWKKNQKYIDHWDETEFIQFADILVKEGALVSAEQYLKTIPHGGFYLHFLPFLQGMLYVGNTTQLNKDEIELIQHVADAFSTAYARYEDFNKLEAAKQQVDKTLTDLKQAQTQLVQSEKMASLGELTAGIAHEIQNPLNFVNNFSDVSNELLEEMKIELEKGNKEDAIAIVEDVKQNLEKILHHGKRADAIVKGMLQHSRMSSGQKEPTDINVLADEYLRLAYHGLRAKDKSFNAKFETEFDNSIEKINIIPQDIGRVILNLINNAFYAVTEKKKVNTNGYEPVVTVTTKKDNSKIEIKVKDNGNGIPQKVLDKIFQPFFTTKPTGQGTGLGLSLAYDIVTKGHGGELKVETREGEGSEFVIQLPVSKPTES